MLYCDCLWMKICCKCVEKDTDGKFWRLVLMSWRHERKCYRELYHCDTNAMYCSSKPAAESAVTSHLVCMLRGYTAILKYLLLLICLHRKVKPARYSSYLQIPRADNSLKQVIILSLAKRFTCQGSKMKVTKSQKCRDWWYHQAIFAIWAASAHPACVLTATVRGDVLTYILCCNCQFHMESSDIYLNCH